MEPLLILVKNMVSKKDIRKSILEKRNQIVQKKWEENSRRIYEKVVTHPFFLDAEVIYCYVDYRNEVCTRDIIINAWKSDKKVAVPRIQGDTMTFHYITDWKDLKEGFKGILEPLCMPEALDDTPLIIMPGVAFDRDCNRIGYGKGFYDKFLEMHPRCTTIALSFELQLVEKVPTQDNDICPQILITEENIYECTTAK